MEAETQAIMVSSITADIQDPSVVDRIHALEHAHRVENLFLDREDMARCRLRARTDGGTEIRIALPREQNLFDGAVLLLEENRAVVVRQEAETWLSIEVDDIATALELGYFAGNMHWRVRFEGSVLRIAATGELDSMIERLQPLMASGALRQVIQ